MCVMYSYCRCEGEEGSAGDHQYRQYIRRPREPSESQGTHQVPGSSGYNGCRGRRSLETQCLGLTQYGWQGTKVSNHLKIN